VENHAPQNDSLALFQPELAHDPQRLAGQVLLKEAWSEQHTAPARGARDFS
jgi:hypothetical protein